MSYRTALLKDGTEKNGVNPQQVRRGGGGGATFKDAKDMHSL